MDFTFTQLALFYNIVGFSFKLLTFLTYTISEKIYRDRAPVIFISFLKIFESKRLFYKTYLFCMSVGRFRIKSTKPIYRSKNLLDPYYLGWNAIKYILINSENQLRVVKKVISNCF